MIPMHDIPNIQDTFLIFFNQGTFSAVMLECCQTLMVFNQYTFYVGNYFERKSHITLKM